MSWAGCRWRWSRPPPTCRPPGHPSLLPGLVPAAPGRPAGPGEPTGYSKTVATTWALAFERLQQADPGAVGLLRLLACCAPEAIPLRLLLQPRPGLAEQLAVAVAPVLVPLLDDPLAASDAIAALRRYSLVSPPADGSVSVHRLVQAVTLVRCRRSWPRRGSRPPLPWSRLRPPGDATQPATGRCMRLLLPHAQAVLAADSDGMRRIASYLGFSGNYAAARDLCQRVLEARAQVSRPEHPDTLFARSHLAFWTGQAGDAAGARDQFAALLPVIERVLGPEHEGLLPPAATSPTGPGRRGMRLAARDQFAALLPVIERVCGPEHWGTLVARGDLARWTGEAGDVAGARDQFAALLPVTERVGDPEHPDALAIRANLARWTGEAGDAAGARDQFAALLPVVERVCGPEHPDTLATAPTSPAGPGRRGMRLAPATSSPRCCRCASGGPAPCTRPP